MEPCAGCDIALAATETPSYLRLQGHTVYMTQDHQTLIKLFDITRLQDGEDVPGVETPLEAWLRETLIHRFVSRRQTTLCPEFRSAGVALDAAGELFAWLTTGTCKETLRDWMVQRLTDPDAESVLESTLAHPEILHNLDLILEGLLALHRLGVIHGDFHPGNIMRTDSSSVGWQFIDFGLARLIAGQRRQLDLPAEARGAEEEDEANVAAAAKREWLGLREALTAPDSQPRLELDALLAPEGCCGMVLARALTRMQPQFLDATAVGGGNTLQIDTPVVDLIELNNELWKLLLPEDFSPTVSGAHSRPARELEERIRGTLELSRRWLLAKIKLRIRTFAEQYPDLYAVRTLLSAVVHPMFY